jgi:arylsulfatase A-like enzyme
VFDTARADAFAPYGAPADVTPTFTQLASRGAVVDQAYAPACWTVPSHGALFSGLLPRTTQIGPGAHGRPARITEMIEASYERLLPTVLTANGYATAGVSTNAWVSPRIGFDRGFQQFQLLTGERRGMPSNAPKERIGWALESLRARVDDGARAVERLLNGWLTARTDDPFFWFVNLVECHSPYLPPRPYNDLGPGARVRAGEEARQHLTFRALTRACLGPLEVPDDALERMRHLYRRSIRLLDDWLARVIDSLDRAGVLDETIVIVTSDHGENFGENELMGHGYSLDQRLIRVPFLTVGPMHLEHDRIVSLTDVPRLVAGAIGLDEHPWQGDPHFDVAVAQLDSPCAPDDPYALEALREFDLPATALTRMVRSMTCATDGRLKLFREAGDERIVDLVEDPLENAPVPVGRAHELRHGEVLTRLRAALDAAAALEGERGTSGGPLRIDDPTLEAQLQLLGYL